MPDAYALTREQARAVDRHAIESLGLAGLVLMENAGRGCVDVLEGIGVDGPVVILCGKGNNAGDGFVIARHLMVRGLTARTVLLAPPSEFAGDAAINYGVLRKLGGEITDLSASSPDALPAALDSLDGADWWIDAMLGTGAVGDPREPVRTAIEWVNAQSGKRLAVDLPSGLDCDTGAPGTPTFCADHTVTFVAPKVGFAKVAAAPFLGVVQVADIGVPIRATKSGTWMSVD